MIISCKIVHLKTYQRLADKVAREGLSMDENEVL